MEAQKELTLKMLKMWKNKKVEFYSGRMMMYSLLDALGFDAEKLYDIDPATLAHTSPDALATLLGMES